jgi:hypothetical protein
MISLRAFTFSFGVNLFLLPIFSSGGFMFTPYKIASNSASSAWAGHFLFWTRDAIAVSCSGGIFGGDEAGQWQYRENNFVKIGLTYTF